MMKLIAVEVARARRDGCRQGIEAAARVADDCYQDGVYEEAVARIRALDPDAVLSPSSPSAAGGQAGAPQGEARGATGGTVATLAERCAEKLRRYSAAMTSDDQTRTASFYGSLAALVEAHGRFVVAWNNLDVPGEDGDAALVDAGNALRSLAESLGVAPEQEHRSPQGEERPGERQETEP